MVMAQVEREGEGKVGCSAGQKRAGGRTSPMSYLRFPIFPEFKLSAYEGFEFEFKVNLECGGLGKNKGKVKEKYLGVECQG
jgi:hypothetical protein